MVKRSGWAIALALMGCSFNVGNRTECQIKVVRDSGRDCWEVKGAEVEDKYCYVALVICAF